MANNRGSHKYKVLAKTVKINVLSVFAKMSVKMQQT